MQIGAIYPQNELGGDPRAVREFALAAETLGYRHLMAYDHVVGADQADRDPALAGPYTERDPFHDPFVLFGYLAGVTTHLQFVTGVLILPQRQTALVAKQAAEVDLLSGGRLRLGVGVGWNHIEYESLGMEWKTRGARQAEQIAVMRKLWTEDLVTFHGKYHDLQDVNILPPPVQRPIPIWFGGSADAVIRRCARIGDGWMPILPPNELGEAKLATLHGYLREFGRDPASFGLEAWARVDTPDEDVWGEMVAGWKRLGAQRLMLYPMYRMPTFDAQIDTLRRLMAMVKA